MMKNNIAFIFCFCLLAFIGCKEFDELMPEPQVQTISASQGELIDAFSGLVQEGQGGACNVVYNTAEIPDILCRIVLDAREGSEIVFLVDKTSSMADDIAEVKQNINEIIDCLPEGVRLGAATYGDNREDDPEDWYDRTELTEDYEEIRTYVNAITVIGGGDLPESVYDALWKTLDEMPWKDCKAPDLIIVMADAPPKEGADTDNSAEDVLDKAMSLCPDTEFYPVIIL